jgi:predicted Holliday junction resolvase-like endonuclease
MKFRIWPFCKDDDNTEKKIIVVDVPLEQVSCDVLKEEIERRKKENHKRRIREANAKADRIDRLIDELCNEMAVDIKTESKSTYQEILAKRLTHGLIPYINNYCYITRYGHQDLDIDSVIYKKLFNCVNSVIYETDIDATHISETLKHMKVEYRKMLLKNIKEVC